jgi:hypothetical protein
MAFEHIENLKTRYTDKYVTVDESRPELRRFRGYAGVVKTVNMSGRALVQFDDFENNIGWFDIDVDFLKVLDQPPAKQEKPARAAPAKPTPADKPAAKAAKPAAVPAAGGGGMSVQDILAAARGKPASTGGTAAPAKPAKEETPAKPEAAKPAGQMSVAEIMAAARAEKAGGAAAAPKSEAKPKPAAKPSEESSSLKMETPQAKSPASMSVAEILAAARAEKGGGAAPSAPPVEEPTVEEPASEEAIEPKATPAPPPAEPAEKAPPGELPTTTAEIIAWCRQHDAK